MRNRDTGARRALVTGAAGFVGSHLTDRLLDEGWTVVGVDNFSTGRARNLRHHAGNPRLSLLNAAVQSWGGCEGPFDWIFHFASPASPRHYQELAVDTLRVNGEGTDRLLELAERTGARFFLASTSEVYGDPEVHPQVESYRGNVSSTGPRSMYDEAKRYAEAMTLAHHRARGLDVRIIRIFNTYGPRMACDDGRVISNFITQALTGGPITVYGDGSQTRSFQYVSDLVEAVWRLLEVDHAEPVNVGTSEELTIGEVAEAIARDFGGVPIVYLDLPEDDPTRRRPDTTLLRSLTGFRPRVSLKEGLRRTIPYFLREVRSKEAYASTSLLE
jgi:nucleoside-diphosphate-sugar epimerase